MEEAIKISTLAEQLVELAKNKYPVSTSYKGRLTESDIEDIEKECDICCSSVYMDGTGYYFIRYRKEQTYEHECIRRRIDCS